MKNLFGFLEKYLLLVISGVHAANSVPGVPGTDKKAAVLTTVIAVSDAVAHGSTDPKVVVIASMIDVAAGVVKILTAPPPAPAKIEAP